MYINKFNRETDQATLLSFIQEHTVGMLVSVNTEGVPEATHLPFIVTEKGNGFFLQTHLARANPQWRLLEQQTSVLVIFGGPSAYISPRWYDHINVPTLNYIAVHAYGKPTLITEPEAVYQLLKVQVEQFEKEHIGEYNIEKLPPDMLKSEMIGLVGLEIPIERLEGNFKLSQNRDKANYENIIHELEKSDNTPTLEVAQAMKKIYNQQGYKH
jgi:transcriptional regulator